MKITVLEPANAEMREASEYYDAQRIGLGDDFLQAVQDAIRRIEAFPNAWSAIQEVESCAVGVRVVRVESEAANTIAKINAALLGTPAIT